MLPVSSWPPEILTIVLEAENEALSAVAMSATIFYFVFPNLILKIKNNPPLHQGDFAKLTKNIYKRQNLWYNESAKRTK